MPDDKKPEEKFRAAMKQILTVPKEEIVRRETEYRKQREAKKKQNGTR